MELEWESGERPWFRRAQDEQPANRQQKVLCYFCGATTAILSYGDLPGDHGRLEVYCDSDMCDAREAVVIVRRDGAGAPWRADVRALRAIDEGRLDVDDLAQKEQGDSFVSFPDQSERRRRNAETVERRSARPVD